MVIQEASAANVPVIASDVYGNAEQITHNENGWLFKFKDSNSLKLQLQQFIDSPSLVEKVKNNIKPVKSFSTVASEYVNVYKKALATL